MKEERIYTDAIITKSIKDDGEWETDGNGNPIIIIEASNENLDYDGERVLRSALMGSKDYFEKNGVVSFDHKHLPSPDNYKYDPEWNAEKYIIGKPLEAWEAPGKDGVMTVFVKAVLSKSNAIAKEIIGKLKDKIGTVFASVGGKRCQKSQLFDLGVFRDIPTVVGVLWDEIALTYKPVNQTLGATALSYPPATFVKSLTAGASANPYSMGSGGNTLQMQGPEKDVASALRERFKGMSLEEIVEYLCEHGLSQGQSKKVAGVLINKSIIGGTSMAENVTEEVEQVESLTDELLKALEALEDSSPDAEALAKAMKNLPDGEYLVKGGHGYKKKGDGTMEAMDDDAPEIEPDEDDKDTASVRKSVEDGMYDATEDIVELKEAVGVLKSQNEELSSMVKSIGEKIANQSAAVVAVGKQVVSDSAMIKAIHDSPAPRAASVTDLKVHERFTKSQTEGMANVTQDQLIKSMNNNNVNGETMARANIAFRRGGMAQVAAEVPNVAALFIKEDA
jgi:hypothetical protein